MIKERFFCNFQCKIQLDHPVHVDRRALGEGDLHGVEVAWILVHEVRPPKLRLGNFDQGLGPFTLRHRLEQPVLLINAGNHDKFVPKMYVKFEPSRIN